MKGTKIMKDHVNYFKNHFLYLIIDIGDTQRK